MSRWGLISTSDHVAVARAAIRSMSGGSKARRSGDMADRRERRLHEEREGRQPSRCASGRVPAQRRTNPASAGAVSSGNMCWIRSKRAPASGVFSAEQRLRRRRPPRRRSSTRERPGSTARRSRATGSQMLAEAAVVVEPAMRQEKDLDVVVDRRAKTRPSPAARRNEDGVVEADILGISQRFPVRRQRCHGSERAASDQTDERRADPGSRPLRSSGRSPRRRKTPRACRARASGQQQQRPAPAPAAAAQRGCPSARGRRRRRRPASSCRRSSRAGPK